MESIVKLGSADFASPVVSLALAKANSNITYTDQDTLLTLFLQAAIEDAEQYTGSNIQERDVVIQLKDWAHFVDLPAVPLTTVTSIVYKDEDAADQTLTADTHYEVLKDGYQLHFKQTEFPVLEPLNRFPITITGKVGFAEADDVPPAIRAAILLKFSQKELYREDSPVKGPDRSFHAALRPFKVWG